MGVTGHLIRYDVIYNDIIFHKIVDNYKTAVVGGKM